ncbi:MAG: stage 0 sporulation family protein [Coriobacteriales bacterium]|jgi:cell fate regulator YaaT (PSP1 superfamily)|nr:stage 0 sporulation family protein [Coriobacteriales bacterium]
MTKVVAVKLRYNPKTLWFDPVLGTYAQGDHVIVETERGREIGLVTDPAIEVAYEEVKALKSPLKPVIRALTDLDFDHIDMLDAKGREAMPVFRELIEKHQLDMKPIEVEYLFTGDKAVFYFSSDERVDFRELVRELASHFHIRIDMRQIGVRDEARMLGGLSHCGEELCCARLGGEFQPVSIRMAKEQDLPLNPAKISGACGRLMCCLRYEFEAYKDFKQRAPKKGALIETPLGTAKVSDLDTPREVIHMRLEDGKSLAIPLKEFECDADEKGCTHPCRVSRESVDRCASSSILLALSALDRELDAANEPAPLRDRTARDRGDRDRTRTRDGRSTRDGREGQQPASPTRRRRSSGAGSGAGSTASGGSSTSGPQDAASQAADKPARSGAKPRPGQHSSGVRNPERQGQGQGQRSQQRRRQRPAATDAGSGAVGANAPGETPPSSPGRRRRRRSTGPGNAGPGSGSAEGNG